MSADGSGNPQGPLGITLPDWMKKRAPDRYAFDETPFSPPSPTDECFLIKYPFRGSPGPDPGPGKKESAGSADAFGPAGAKRAPGLTVPGPELTTNTTNLKEGSTGASSKARRNSAVTVLPTGELSIKTYSSPEVAKKSSDPGSYYSTKHSEREVAWADAGSPLLNDVFPVDEMYDSDCSSASVSTPTTTTTPTASQRQQSGGGYLPAHGLASSILGSIGHSLATGTGRDYFAPTETNKDEQHQQIPSAVDRRRRLGVHGYGAVTNPFFTDDSTMKVFSGLYQDRDSRQNSQQAVVRRPDASVSSSSALNQYKSGQVVPSSSMAGNQSSSAYDSQIIAGAMSTPMTGMDTHSNKPKARHWVPKPSKQRELNLFAPCSS